MTLDTPKFSQPPVEHSEHDAGMVARARIEAIIAKMLGI